MTFSCRYGGKRLTPLVAAIGQKNEHRMELIAREKLCKNDKTLFTIQFPSVCRFFAEKLGETDILANLRSEFCISKGPGLYEHQRYCDLYLQCNEQGVGVTMECSRMYLMT